MSRISFRRLVSIEDLNQVNDEQKRIYSEIVSTDPTQRERDIARYLRRWREALAHIKPGSRLLDIGCGWQDQGVFDEITKLSRIDYHSSDIDPLVVAGMADQLAAAGLPRTNTRQLPNTELPYPDGYFDFIFSSHCLEHSTDIVQTLLGCRRILNDAGQMFISVPLGFDDSVEHTLYLGPQEWCRLLELSGFEVVSQIVGQSRLEVGDLVILARCGDTAAIDEQAARDLAKRFSKVDATFIPTNDPVFQFPAHITVNADATTIGLGSVCTVSPDAPAKSLIVWRHKWSGMVVVEDGKSTKAFDAYSHQSFKQAIDLAGFGSSFTVRAVGRNPASLHLAVAVVGVVCDLSAAAVTAGGPESDRLGQRAGRLERSAERAMRWWQDRFGRRRLQSQRSA